MAFSTDEILPPDFTNRNQLTTLAAVEREGLVIHNNMGYELSILGEVFMGHLVHDLKQSAGQRAVDDYISEGHALGRAISAGAVADSNEANNRQIALSLLNEELSTDA